MIDLKKLADRKYKISLDESYEAEQGGKDWYYQIPCKHGHIFVNGENELGVFTGKPNVRAVLKVMPGLTPIQIGDREASFGFAPDLLDKVCEVVKARRRPRLTDEQRQALSDRMTTEVRVKLPSKSATD